MVTTDSRRVEDLKIATEDAGIDVVVTSEAMRAPLTPVRASTAVLVVYFGSLGTSRKFRSRH